MKTLNKRNIFSTLNKLATHHPLSVMRTAAPLLLCAGLAQSVFAQATPVIEASDGAVATSEDFAFARRLSRVFKSVANKTEPAVVHVTQVRSVRPVDFFGRPVGPARKQQSGLGSGAIIDSSGVVLTNNHVIAGGEDFRVRLANGEEYDATLVGNDAQTDLAVLQIANAPSSLPTLSFADSDALEVGEWVIAVGSPFGLDSTVTQGIISARGRSVTPRETGRAYEDYIQTDAAINPGNSGGPLLNLEGKIVGINTAIASRTGGYDGIGFAIPSNTARLVVDSIRQNGRVLRGWLGAGFADLNERNAQPRVQVGSVLMGSPAEQAGLREGDIITRFQGVAMNESRLRNAIATLPSGSVVSLDIDRNGAALKLSATLTDRSTGNNSTLIPSMGMQVVSLDSESAKRLGFNGVVVTDVRPQGRAEGRFLENDIIVSVNGDEIENEREFAEALNDAKFRRGVRFNVLREVERNGQRVLERGRIDVQD